MDRTQIYLTRDEHAALDKAAATTGKTKSQLIREAIDATNSVSAAPQALAQALDGAFGLWAGRPAETFGFIAAGQAVEHERLERMLAGPRAGLDDVPETDR